MSERKSSTFQFPIPQTRIPRHAMRAIKRQILWKDGSPAARVMVLSSRARRDLLRLYRQLPHETRQRVRFDEWLRLDPDARKALIPGGG